MKTSLNKAYRNLGKIIFESGIAEAFDIYPDQEIDSDNQSVRALLGFILHHADESIVYYNDQEFEIISKANIH